MLKGAAAPRRFIGIPSTGSAGLINTIHAFSTASIVTGVFGVIATVGVSSLPFSVFCWLRPWLIRLNAQWGFETAGIVFEYRAVCPLGLWSGVKRD